MNFLLEAIKISFKKNFAYKMNFIFVILDELIDFFGVVILWYSYMDQSMDLQGWNAIALTNFMGFTLISSSISNLFVGTAYLPDLINEGSLDLYLIRPYRTFALINLERCNFLRFVLTFPLGLALAAKGVHSLESFAFYLLALFTCITASFVLECMGIMLYVFSFWLKNSSMLSFFFRMLTSIKKYPLHYITNKAIKILITFVPVIFTATIPTRIQTFHSGFQLVAILIGITLATGYGLKHLWLKGLQYYESAN